MTWSKDVDESREALDRHPGERRPSTQRLHHPGVSMTEQAGEAEPCIMREGPSGVHARCDSLAYARPSAGDHLK